MHLALNENVPLATSQFIKI